MYHYNKWYTKYITCTHSEKLLMSPMLDCKKVKRVRLLRGVYISAVLVTLSLAIEPVGGVCDAWSVRRQTYTVPFTAANHCLLVGTHFWFR